MTKDEFMKISTYEEFDKRRAEVNGLDFSDQEIRQHFSSLFPKPKHPIEEGIIEDFLYKRD